MQAPFPSLHPPLWTTPEICKDETVDFFLLDRFGPNTFPAHNSVLFASEVQVDYLARTLIAPIIDRRLRMLEVKPTSEDQWVNAVHRELSGSVFEAGCSNWYINPFGRNSASWPGYASTYWKEALEPQIGVFKTRPGSRTWFINTISRWIRTSGPATYFAVAAVTSLLVNRGLVPEPATTLLQKLGEVLFIPVDPLVKLWIWLIPTWTFLSPSLALSLEFTLFCISNHREINSFIAEIDTGTCASWSVT